jgi:hypothetical protein
LPGCHKSNLPIDQHRFLRLAEKTDLELTDKVKEQLVTITAFNINARYDDYKMSFKNQCTPEYTAEWINNLVTIQVSGTIFFKFVYLLAKH